MPNTHNRLKGNSNDTEFLRLLPAMIVIAVKQAKRMAVSFSYAHYGYLG